MGLPRALFGAGTATKIGSFISELKLRASESLSNLAVSDSFVRAFILSRFQVINSKLKLEIWAELRRQSPDSAFTRVP